MVTGITGRTAGLLRDVVAAIVAKTPRVIGLTSLERETDEVFAEIPAYLTQGVEVVSNNHRTVRLADPALFADHTAERCHYLVVCDYGTPDGTVVELSKGMVLVRIFAFRSGFDMPARRQTLAGVAEYRAATERARRMGEERDRANEAALQFRFRLAELAIRAARLAAQSMEPADRTYLAELVTIYIGPDSPRTWQGIALVCDRLGISLPELARRELPDS